MSFSFRLRGFVMLEFRLGECRVGYGVLELRKRKTYEAELRQLSWVMWRGGSREEPLKQSGLQHGGFLKWGTLI